MSSADSNANPPSDAAEDAEKIRLKRLAKLGGTASPSTSSPRPAAPIPQVAKNMLPKRSIHSTPSSPPNGSTAARLTPTPRTISHPKPQIPIKLDRSVWEEECIESVFLVTLNNATAVKSDYSLVWLKSLFTEMESERGQSPKLGYDDIDRVLISRLELTPDSMSDDLEYLPVLASLPPNQTVMMYLVGCWKRLNSRRSAFGKIPHVTEDSVNANALFVKMNDLVVSYVGLTINEPDIFPQPSGHEQLGAAELIPSLQQLGTFTSPHADSDKAEFDARGIKLNAHEVEHLFADLCHRYEESDDADGLGEVIAPIVKLLLFDQTLAHPSGILTSSTTSASGWRGILVALELLVSKKAIASVITGMNEWLPLSTNGFHVGNANEIEMRTLMGPLARIGVFDREWPQVSRTYFDNASQKTRADLASANNSIRTTLDNLQGGLFRVFDSLVRSGPANRTKVLQYFGSIVTLNVKRGGSHVNYKQVSSDSFLINLQCVLLRFCDPFMDSKQSKLSRVDTQYLAMHGGKDEGARMNLSDETRLHATAQEVTEWSQGIAEGSTAAPNFITDIFYLTAAMNHFAMIRIIQSEQQLYKAIEDRESAVTRINDDPTWQGSPMQARVEAEIEKLKTEINRAHAQIYAFQSQLLDPVLTQRMLAFCGFMTSWLIKLVDPTNEYPAKLIQLPLPREPPTAFKMLPEFFMEDMADYYLYLIRHAPHLIDVTAQTEVINLCITFLTSTWYIKNPFLKSKLVQILFWGTLGWNRDKTGILNNQLNSHPLCLQHLMSALTGFYIEIESTGSHTQFYDKFNSRRDIAYILNAIWHTPRHREALKVLASDLTKFTRFVNLMMNDVTFLLDESLSKLSEISKIEREMRQPTWEARPARERQESQSQFHAAGSQATSWLSLTKSTLDLLQKFTSETKAPFMTPEIVDRLAAMLNYNLEALVGPKCNELKVKDPEKYKFNPKQLLSEILQVYLNLCGESEFVRAIASEGRSYRASLFASAFKIADNNSLKTPTDMERLRQFVEEVEEMKATLIAEEDFDDIPDEFLDPLMATLMRDPVILPSSNAIVDRATIKAHLLSDNKDPFNRVPLALDDIAPAVDLKSRIDQFIEGHRARRQQARDSEMDVDHHPVLTD